GVQSRDASIDDRPRYCGHWHAQGGIVALEVIVVMDPIGSIKIVKDTSFALLLEAQRRGHRVHVAEISDLRVHDGTAQVRATPVTVRDDPRDWFTPGQPQVRALRQFD